MADLITVERRIAELRAEIAPALGEIEALETVARALRALDRGESLTRPKAADLSGLTMPATAAQILLEEGGKPLHYKSVAKIALTRGFQGPRTKAGTPFETIAASFRRMMAQDKTVFQATGRGYFRVTKEFLENPRDMT